MEFAYMQGMTEQQKMLFLTQYNAMKKDTTVGVLLCFFLGVFGAHRFYMGQTGMGVLYLVFFWTGISAIICLVECFLMPGRIREYNAEQAYAMANQVRAAFPAASAPPAAPQPALG
jgi:TM2 domain-containing membrane protein YozV